MAKESRPQKSETLTIRLDPKSRFILEFMSRAKGQTITTVVERAIIESASNVSVDEGNTRWQDLWNVSEGCRAIKIASHDDLYPTFEEEKLIEFTKSHYDFFYADRSSEILKSGIIDIIWPRIREFMEYWDDHKSNDFFGAGKKMAEAVRAAGVQPPAWPPPAKPASTVPVKTSPLARGAVNDVLDDDIPF